MGTSRLDRGPATRSLRLLVLVTVVIALIVPASVPAHGAQSNPQCFDYIDNDGDGLTDYPADPQCEQGPGDPPGLSSDDDEDTDGYQSPFGDGAPPGGESPPTDDEGSTPPEGSDTPPFDGGGGGFGSCSTSSGPATISNVFAKSGGDWEEVTGDVCASLTYTETPDPAGGTTRYVVVAFQAPPGGMDLSSFYPGGTEFSFDLTSSGPDPLFFIGAADDPVASIDGNTITVQGKSAQVKFSFQYGASGPNCSAGTTTMSSFFGGAVMLEPSGGGLSDELLAYAGGYFGTNAQQTTLPTVSDDGQSASVTIWGCGDGDPSTEDGFFQGFIPIDGTSEGGLTEKIAQPLANVDEQSVDDLNLVTLEDNGEPQPDADLEFVSEEEVVPEDPGGTSEASNVRAAADDGDQVAGIFIEYHTSFSEHEMTTRVNTAAVKRAAGVIKACKHKHGKLKIVKKKKLICQSKKKKKKRTAEA